MLDVIISKTMQKDKGSDQQKKKNETLNEVKPAENI